MQETDVTLAYAELLAGKLGFDRALSRRVRREVEDHLREAVAAAVTGDREDAERAAIANFGDPQVIAAELAAASLVKQIRNVGIAAALIIGGVFTMMKARVAWYVMTQWGLGDDIRTIAGTIGAIDAYAFWLSVALALVAFAYIGSAGNPIAFDTKYGLRLQRFSLLGIATALALSLSVISDGVLTVLRLREAEFSPASLIPISSAAVEIGCAGVLGFLFGAMILRASKLANLLRS